MLEIADITNDLFQQFHEAPAVQQSYVDMANAEVLDIAITKDVDPANIVEPWHIKIIEYAKDYAVLQFAKDRAGFNHESRYQEADIYTQLYIRQRYACQESKTALKAVMFTGEEQTSENRAYGSIELERA